jgi:hypothetical protein
MLCRTNEELNRAVKALGGAEKRTEALCIREDDLKRTQTSLKATIEKLRLENESVLSVSQVGVICHCHRIYRRR